MEFFRKSTQQPSTLLATPPPKRMSTPAGDKLATILENTDGSNRENVQPRPLSGQTWSGKSRNGTLPRHSADHAPPPYASREWRKEEHMNEKISWRKRLAGRRGGLGRTLVIALIVLLVLVALAVGLGVGLTRRSRSESSNASGDAESSQDNPQQFPLGQYTFVTSLRSVQTDCTSNPASWRCYPYSNYQDSNSTAGLALFNWFITSDGKDFPSNGSASSTNSAGISTGLRVSSSRDPFSIPLNNQNLTYVNDANNPRYIFTFNYAKNVAPSSAVGTSNTASTCYFNQTQFSATLYLTSSRAQDYPGEGLTGSAQVQGGYPRWPYGVEIKELSGGGTDVPACYETTNGAIGQRINTLTPQSADRQCSCNYRNFDA